MRHVASASARRAGAVSALRSARTESAVQKGELSPTFRFSVIGHSLGGIYARYYGYQGWTAGVPSTWEHRMRCVAPGVAGANQSRAGVGVRAPTGLAAGTVWPSWRPTDSSGCTRLCTLLHSSRLTLAFGRAV